MIQLNTLLQSVAEIISPQLSALKIFLIWPVVYFRAKDKTDLDVLRENHRFLWRDEDEDDMTW